MCVQHSTLYGDAMRIAILAEPLWPRETAELLIRLGWLTVRGNHDCWVTDCPPEKHYRSDAFAYQALDSYHNQLA